MEMSPELWKQVATNGIFAVLFVGLLIYVLKQNERRENKLTTVLQSLSESYAALKEEVCTIRDCLKDTLGRK